MKGILDDYKQGEICAIVMVGGTRRLAAEYVGCHPETIRRTCLRDPQFAERLRKADCGPEINLLRAIQIATKDPKQWRAAAWALERLFPERYARRRPGAITPEQLDEVIRQIGAI